MPSDFLFPVGTFHELRKIGEQTALAEERKTGGESSGQKERGRTFFDAGVIPQLIAPRALTPQVARGQDSAGHTLWTPAAPALVGPGQA